MGEWVYGECGVNVCMARGVSGVSGYMARGVVG